MSKGLIVLLAVLGIFGLVAAVGSCGAGYGVNKYNELAKEREDVKATLGQVQNVYQRRADLVPRLVKAVSAYAKHERGTFTDVIEARAKATQVRIDPSNVTPASLKQFQQAQGELSSALSRLMMVTENYPELKASQLFQDFMTEYTGTENRISVERKRYIDAANAFNKKVVVFPVNALRALLPSIFDFQPYPTFEAEKGAERAPDVDFDIDGKK
ncbi:MAG: LemA family protein [Parcubacteria group bacterium]|nr:LemA family protein [Parcubacteria group bacterium]